MKLTVAAFLLAAPAVAARRPNGKIHRGTKAVRPNRRMMRNAKHISGPKIRQLDDNNQNQQQPLHHRTPLVPGHIMSLLAKVGVVLGANLGGGDLATCAFHSGWMAGAEF